VRENKVLLNFEILLRPKKICVIRVTQSTLFFSCRPYIFFHLLKKKIPVGQNGDFRRYVAGMRPCSRQHQAYCHIFGKNICLPMSFVRFTNLPASANSAQTAQIYFSSPVGDLRNAAWGENLAVHFPK
jgi:hypothetical protein